MTDVGNFAMVLAVMALLFSAGAFVNTGTTKAIIAATAASQAEIASACAANQYASSESATGVLTCAQVAITQVTGNVLYSLVQGSDALVKGAASFVNSTSIGVDELAAGFKFKLLTQACAANNFISTLGDTITCTQPSYSGLSGTLCGNGVLCSRTTTTTTLSTTAPTLVQNTFATFTSGTSGSKAFASNVGSLNTILVCAGQSGTSVLPATPTDTLSLTYLLLIGTSLSTAAMQCWIAVIHNGGSDTITEPTYGATCTSTNLCTLFINEVSGIDTLGNTANIGSGTSATSLVIGSNSFTNTPLLLAFYQKATSGTDTAGTSFTLLNGETGSLLYLTEKSTSLTSTSTTYPATAGTATNFAGVGVVLVHSTNLFSISLNANTNYVFHSYYSVQASTSPCCNLIHSMNSGASLVLACITGTQTLAQNLCIKATDTKIPSAGLSTAAQSYELWGTITVGSTATTLTIDYYALNGVTNALQTYDAGCWIVVYPIA